LLRNLPEHRRDTIGIRRVHKTQGIGEGQKLSPGRGGGGERKRGREKEREREREKENVEFIKAGEDAREG